MNYTNINLDVIHNIVKLKFVIKFISPSSGGSSGPVWPILFAQRWHKPPFISFLESHIAQPTLL